MEKEPEEDREEPNVGDKMTTRMNEYNKSGENTGINEPGSEEEISGMGQVAYTCHRHRQFG